MTRDSKGITIRHSRSCSTTRGKQRCDCSPTYRVQIRRDNAEVSRTFTSLKAAEMFRADAVHRLAFGHEIAANYTVGDALHKLQDDLSNGVALNRSGDAYKPSVSMGYCKSIDRYLLPALEGRLASVRVSELSSRHVAALRDEIQARGLDASTVKNAIMPLRVLCRREQERGTLERDPFKGVTFAAVRGTRDRVATAVEAITLLDALDYPDRAFFALAFYAGLRSGEISALQWRDIDYTASAIRVCRAYCSRSNRVTPPKSDAGARLVPLLDAAMPIIEEYRAALATSEGVERIAPEALVFASSTAQPLRGTVVTLRAVKAWKRRDLTVIGLHEGRHTYASLMAAAGVPIEQLSDFMGHASFNLTVKTYRHLYPESRIAATTLANQYLANAANALATGNI